MADPDLGERLVERDLPRRRGQQVLTAEHVGDLHQRVVDRVDQRVERVAVRADEHEVRDVLGQEGDLAPHQVLEDDRAVGHPEPEHRPAPGRDEVGDLVRVEVAAVAVVPAGLVLGAGGLAALVDLLLRAVAVVGLAGLVQRARHLGVRVEPLGLQVGAVGAADLRALVPVETEPAQRVDHRGVALGGVAGEVGVLDAQHQGAAEVTGERPVEQRAADVADVQRARGRRWEPDPDLVRGDAAEDVEGCVSHELPPCSSGFRCRRW